MNTEINFSLAISCCLSSGSCLSWKRKSLFCGELDCEICVLEMILESGDGEESETCDLTETCCGDEVKVIFFLVETFVLLERETDAWVEILIFRTFFLGVTCVEATLTFALEVTLTVSLVDCDALADISAPRREPQ